MLNIHRTILKNISSSLISVISPHVLENKLFFVPRRHLTLAYARRPVVEGEDIAKHIDGGFCPHRGRKPCKPGTLRRQSTVLVPVACLAQASDIHLACCQAAWANGVHVATQRLKVMLPGSKLILLVRPSGQSQRS